jgi:hypothetical protein
VGSSVGLVVGLLVGAEVGVCVGVCVGVVVGLYVSNVHVWPTCGLSHPLLHQYPCLHAHAHLSTSCPRAFSSVL